MSQPQVENVSISVKGWIKGRNPKKELWQPTITLRDVRLAQVVDIIYPLLQQLQGGMLILTLDAVTEQGAEIKHLDVSWLIDQMQFPDQRILRDWLWQAVFMELNPDAEEAYWAPQLAAAREKLLPDEVSARVEELKRSLP